MSRTLARAEGERAALQGKPRHIEFRIKVKQEVYDAWYEGYDSVPENKRGSEYLPPLW